MAALFLGYPLSNLPPATAGEPIRYLRNDGLQNQSVLHVMDSLDGQPRVILDFNTWSKDGKGLFLPLCIPLPNVQYLQSL